MNVSASAGKTFVRYLVLAHSFLSRSLRNVMTQYIHLLLFALQNMGFDTKIRSLFEFCLQY